MYTSTDLDKLQQIMAETPEHEAVITRLLNSHTESLSTITHEIRNPLTMVYSTLQMIESSHPEVHTFKHWDALHEDIEYMIQLLAELSSYNNAGVLSMHQIDTVHFLRKIALSFAASVVDSPVEFSSCIAPDLPDIQGDTNKLKEVLLNLLKNALESFSSEAAGSIYLSASTENSESSLSPMLQIQIEDTGCGIPPEHLEDIFQPFVTYKSNGTGLGLALSKRMIEAHSGRLSVHSTVDVGTTFTILLPVSSSCDKE